MLGPYFQGFPASSIVSAALSLLGVLAPSGASAQRQPSLELLWLFHSPPLFFFFLSFNTSHGKVPVLLRLFIPLAPLHDLSATSHLFHLLAFGWVQVRHAEACAENQAFLLSENPT